MAHLRYPSSSELELQLGPHENEILSVVRHCGWWTRAKIEGRAPGEAEVVAVSLFADRSMDTTVREILQRSFQLIFPVDGGEGEHGIFKRPAYERHRTTSNSKRKGGQ